MWEIGIDIFEQTSKQITPELTDSAEMIISMSQERLPSYVDQRKITLWDVPDPASEDYDFYCQVRDKIDGLVKGLSSRLNKI